MDAENGRKERKEFKVASGSLTGKVEEGAGMEWWEAEMQRPTPLVLPAGAAS